MVPVDSFRHKGLRNALVHELIQLGINDENVLQAFEKVPRHWFVDPSLWERAYNNTALPIECDQTISQPSTVAFQSQLLEVSPGMKVLEIGTGSGYQSAILYEMGATVYTLERQKALFNITKEKLFNYKYRINCYLGDGYNGLTEINYAPYDRILITCGASEVPISLFNQLKLGGIMVIPVGGEHQEMLRIIKQSEDISECKIESFGDCQFVPMLKNINFRKF